MDQTAVTKMIGRSKKPGDSDTRHSTPKQNHPNPWIQYPNKPYLNVTLDNTHKIKALVDSGSAISLADLSTMDHITNKATGGPPISMTSCQNTRVNSRGCYKATIDVDEDLPYPTRTKQIRIHVINNLSSELILGNDFLKENGAVINPRDNSVIFSPKRTTAIARSGSQTLQGTAMVFEKGITPYEDLVDDHQNTHTLHPKETKLLGQRDQITFHAKIKTDTSTIFKPGTTVMITSSLTPTPCVPDGLYSTKDDNMVQITIRNTEVYPIELIKGKPITGITVYLLDKYYNRTAKPEDTLRTYPGENTGLIYEHYPSGSTPKQHWENKNLQHDTPLLNPGINNLGMRKHPILGPSTTNLPVQLDIKDVEQDQIPVYQQIIPRDDNAHLRNKPDMGHIPHHHHRIECIHHDKTSVAAEQASDELVTNPKTTHTLIEQPNVRNTPIFMVAIKDGSSVGTGRFVQDFRKRNTAYQDDENITQNSRKSLIVTNKFKPGICSENGFTSTACGPPLGKPSQGVTSSKTPWDDTQYSETRTLRCPRGIGKFLSKPHRFQITKEGANHENDLVTTTTTHKKRQRILNTIFTDCSLHKMKLRPNRSILKQKEPVWLGYTTEELQKITLQGRPLAKTGRHNVTETISANSDLGERTFPFRAHTAEWTPCQTLTEGIRVGPPPGAGLLTIIEAVSTRAIQEMCTFPFFAQAKGLVSCRPLTRRTELVEDVELLPGTGPLNVTGTVSTESIQETIIEAISIPIYGPAVVGLIVGRFGTSAGTPEADGRFDRKLAENTEGVGKIVGVPGDLSHIENSVHEPTVARFMVRHLGTSAGTPETGRRFDGRLTENTEDMRRVVGVPSDLSYIENSIHEPAVVRSVVRHLGTPVGTFEADRKFALKRKNMAVNTLWSTENQKINKRVQHHKPTPTYGNTRLYMDIMGPLITRRGQKHILAIINTFTRYAELVEIPNGETVTVTQALLDQWIVRHGFYEQIISDHGRTFASE